MSEKSTKKTEAKKYKVPTGLGGSIIAGLALLLLLGGGVGYWASSAPLASAVLAQGFVTVDGHRKAVQHADGGVVKRLLAKDGDAVKAGQPLIELDETRPLAAFKILRANFDALKATEARLKAEQNGADKIKFPEQLTERSSEDEIDELLSSQKNLFEARHISLTGEREILIQRIAQLDEEIVGLKAQRDAKGKQLRFIEDELTGLRSLFSKGHASRPRILALEREAAKIGGERGEIVAQIARAKKSGGETKLQILQLQNKFRENVVAELRDVQTRLTDTGERLAAAKTALDRIVIRAPVAGTIVGMTVHNQDAFISQGQTIAEIVPEEDPLMIEAKIRPVDIDSLIIGQKAEVRILAFKQRTTKPFEGTFAFVSADKLIDQNSGEPYFRALIKVNKPDLEQNDKSRLLPGMPAEVIIKTGTRTALDYIIDPVLTSVNRAWREN